MLVFNMENLKFSFSVYFALFLCRVTDAAWSYTGNTGPSYWSNTYADCGYTSQSPVDLTGASVDASLGAFTLSGFDNTAGTHTVENNGHALKVTIDSSVTITVSGGSLGHTYRVNQFHFHWGSVDTQGSEHTVDGNMYPLELHIVTYDSDTYSDIASAQTQTEGLAVLGFLFEIQSSDNSAYTALLNTISSVVNNAQTTTLTSFALNNLVPSGWSGSSTYYRYSGSLTTPSCYQSVVWTVFKDTVKISSSQLATFRNMFSDAGSTTLQDNYRPVQSLNSRTIKTSGSSKTVSDTIFIMLVLILMTSINNLV